jgi:hypothetical protein
VKTAREFRGERVAAGVATSRYEVPTRDGKPVSIQLEQEVKVTFDY